MSTQTAVERAGLAEAERAARSWPFFAAQFAEARTEQVAQARTCVLSLAKSCATIGGGDDSCGDDCIF
jgi:hypothetical protein